MPRHLQAALATAVLIGGWTMLSAPASAQETVTYGYDALGRVGWVEFGTGNTTRYDYDPAGNRLEAQTTTATGGFAPIAVVDQASTRVSQTIQIYVMTNDFSPEGRTLAITGVTSPDGGTATIGGGGAYVTYSAPAGPNAYGDYGFSYTITDSQGKTDSTGVSIRVLRGEGYCELFPDDEWCG